MSQQITVIGGAEIGWLNATWPLARLSASSIELSIVVTLLGTYTFTPSDVVALEPYHSIPVIGRGIRIVHSRPDYPEKIIFWCFRNPEVLVDNIRTAGFRPRAVATIPRKPRGIPIKWTAIAATVITWNMLFVLDGAVPWAGPKPPGPFVFLAVALMFATALATQRSATVQALVLKPGRSAAEITSFLRLMQLVSGLMLVGLAFAALLGQPAG